jgi:hypothetical protein
MTDNTFTLGLSLLDFLPNLAFLVNSYFLARLVQLSVGRFPFALMIMGTVLVFLGGTFKALWKLLFTIGSGDFQILSQIQFILLAPGFLAMLVSLVLFVKQERKRERSLVIGIAPWKIPLLASVTLSSMGVLGILVYLAIHRKANWAAVLFAGAIICMLGMAGMASGEQSVEMQWIEEGINSLGQIAWAFGSYLLYSCFRSDQIN